MKYIKDKKGFTMIELLSVVGILAILVIIVIPNVLKMFRSAKKDAFVTEAKSLYNTVMKQNFLTSNEPHTFNTGSLDISGGKNLEYSISTNQSGQVVCFQVADSNYMWIYRSMGLPLTSEEDIAKDEELGERDPDVILDCNGADLFDVTVPATLAGGGTWWSGQTPKSQIERIIFTYSYSETDNDEKFFSDEEKVGGLTTFVKGKIAYVVINRNKRKNKAIKMSEDASNTFSGFNNLKNIQGLKLLDFSNVTNMDNFFGRVENGNVVSSNSLTYINGYESFNTSNVRSARYAFAGVKLSTINLSNWYAGSMQDVTGMFYKSTASMINLSGWNVSGITKYNDMFASSGAENINLDGWNTNGNADYTGMFNNCSNLVSITSSNDFKVNNTNVTMFKNDSKIIGGNGTTFSTDKSSHAKLDAEGNPGYLSLSNGNGILVAKLYNTGSVSGSYTDLTTEGSIPPDWNYYSGARLLEVKLFSMKSGSTKTLEISVPAGMYIVNNSWTKSGHGISSVNFTKLSNQGTGSYSNSQTGTLKYTFGSNTTSSSIQLLVMFDATIWDKNRKGATYSSSSQNMTVSAPVIVNYNNGASIKKIANIYSATGIGNAADGMGYTSYSWNYNSNIYVDDPTRVFGNHYLLMRDQSSASFFYKKVEYKTFATFKDINNLQKNADIEDDYFSTELGSSAISIVNENDYLVYKGEWNNVYTSGTIHFPRPKYTVKSSDNPKIGSNLTVKTIVILTSLSGQITTYTTTKTYTIKGSAQDAADVGISYGNKTSPYDSYYGDSGYSGILGIFTMYNKGLAPFNNTDVVFEYDTGTAKNNPPSMKVMAARPFLQSGQQVNAKITLINDSGSEVEIPSYTIKSTSNTAGAYVLASKVASANGLSGNYYLKKIEYTIPVVSGVKEDTGQVNYLYSSSGNSSQTSGGNFMGTISKASTSKLTITIHKDDGTEVVKTTTSTSGVTNTPSFSGYINKINTPLGTEFNAGEDIELAINVISCSYPYTNTQAFRKPEVYLVLPFGINIDSVIIGNSAGATSSEVQPVVSKIKNVYVGDVLSNVYKITTGSDLWFGYLSLKESGPSSGSSSSKWFRVRLTTDMSMEYTSINLRDSIYFKDAYGQVYVSGSYAKNAISDKYDVDGDGSTSDVFGTTDNANQTIKIYGSDEEEEETVEGE